MSENMQAMTDSGMLANYINKADASALEHHLNNMRGTDQYAALKRQIERLKGCKVRIENNHPRIRV